MNARVDFSRLPLGKPFDPSVPPHRRHRLCRPWRTPLTPHSYWNQPSHLEVIEEAGQRVLAHQAKHDDCLIVGDGFDSSYTVEARTAQLSAEAAPNNDDRSGTVGKTGPFARYQTLRHYYQFCIEGLSRLVLYRRADEEWHILAAHPVSVAPGSHCVLTMRLEHSDIYCYFNGREVYRVRDQAYARGKAGWRTNTDSRLTALEVRSVPAAHAIDNHVRARYRAEVAAESEKHPRAVLWREVPKRDLSGAIGQLGHATDPGSWTVLMHSSTAVYTPDGHLDALLALIDLDGTPVWRRELPVRFPRLVDLTGDGLDDVICFLDDHLTALDGATGEVLAQTPLPEGQRPGGERGPIWPEFNGIAVADLRGIGRPSDIVLKEENHTGGHHLWAYDAELDPLWHAEVGWPRYGHGIDFWDIDGDGRDEVMAGYDLLSADGQLLRRVVGCEETNPLGSCHADVVAIGPFGEGGEVLAGICTGSDGFWLVDLASSEPIAKHRIGHAQGISVGKFFPDIPGLEFCVGTRWDNYGIVSFFSARGERLFTFEPDNVSQGGPPVNWRGDGSELLLLSSTAEALGMYDHAGRKVVEFPPDFPEREFYGQIGGAPMVMDVTGDARDEIIFNTPDALFIYTQSPAPAPPNPVYAPRRIPRGNILPHKSIPSVLT